MNKSIYTPSFFVRTMVPIGIFSEILGMLSATPELSWLGADVFQLQWPDSFTSLNTRTLVAAAAQKTSVLNPDRWDHLQTQQSRSVALGEAWRFREHSFLVHWCEAMQREVCWARRDFFTLAAHERVRHVSSKLLIHSENNCKPI